MPPIVRLMRPHQYAKNLLVFAAPGAAGRLDEISVVGQSILAFALFSVVSSIGYVANDLSDVEADRLHPKKKYRPLASGEVSRREAILLLAVLAVAAGVFAPFLGAWFVLVLASYGAVSLSYSFVFKQVPWLELLFVSGGFVLRAVGGGAATDTRLSGWFLLVVSAGALLLIAGKRIGELIALGSDTPSRKVLASYELLNLQLGASMASHLAVGGYGAWAAAEADNRVTDSFGSTLLRLTAIPFAAAIARYLVLSWRGAGETPESLIVRDHFMVASGAIWTLVYAVGLYLSLIHI